jgi:hypothetical protein
MPRQSTGRYCLSNRHDEWQRHALVSVDGRHDGRLLICRLTVTRCIASLKCTHPWMQTPVGRRDRASGGPSVRVFGVGAGLDTVVVH